MTAGLGLRLRQERLKTGLNQADFAYLGGVSRNSQGEYESGKTAPNTDYLGRLAVRGVDVNFIVTGNASPDSLNERETALIAKVRSLPPEWQDILSLIADQVVIDGRGTALHQATAGYRASPSPERTS